MTNDDDYKSESVDASRNPGNIDEKANLQRANQNLGRDQATAERKLPRISQPSLKGGSGEDKKMKQAEVAKALLESRDSLANLQTRQRHNIAILHPDRWAGLRRTYGCSDGLA